MVLSFVRRLTGTQIIKKIFGNYHKLDQEILDITRALVCMKCNENGFGSSDPSPEVAQKYFEDIEDLSPKVRRNLLTDKMNEQIRIMFQNIYLYEESKAGIVGGINSNSSNSDNRNSGGSHFNDAFIQHLKNSNGFALEVCESAVEGAGKGLFANGSINRGQVVTLFSGTIYMREFLNNDLKMKLMPDENLQLIGRKDHHYIDCRDTHGLYNNPYGLGKYVNHVPPNASPNVALIAFDFTKDFVENKTSFPSHLHRYIPLKYHQTPTKMGSPEALGILFPTLALVATRPIEHEEEILMDYRLNPARRKEYPSWYVDHDIDAAIRWRMSDLELDRYLKDKTRAEDGEGK